jgi:Phosphodiester glycosidase
VPDEGVSSLPASTLWVRRHGWRAWWRADAAPTRWDGESPTLAAALAWTRARPGVEWTQIELAGTGEAWRLEVVVVRLDPARLRFALDTLTRDYGSLGGWTVDSAPSDVVVALNAGQFTGGTPWGWVVRDGRELQPPGAGPLSSAFVVDTAGRAHVIAASEIDAWRGRARLAFQSYPTLLDGEGRVPMPLRGIGAGIDVAHRDARLALGERRDGTIVVVLTRFGALGDAFGSLPFGPTVPELAAIMGALGCRRAVALDGGISGQLLVRELGGVARVWRGFRRVPLALVVGARRNDVVH